MKYIDYQERAQQGTFNFPIAFYHQTPHSPRYDMQYHWHTQYEIIRIISGTFQLKLESRQCFVRLAMLFLSPAECFMEALRMTVFTNASCLICRFY